MGHRTKPWSDLPIDLLFNILSPLEIGDLLRVSAVCTSFHHAVSLWRRQTLHHHHHPPWLMLNNSRNNASYNNAYYYYYSLSEEKIYKLPMSDSEHIIGSWHGWLVSANEKSDLHLTNPLTGTHVPLPPVKTLEFNPDDEDEDTSWYTLTCHIDDDVAVDQLWRRCYKVVFSCNPSYPTKEEKNNFTAIIIHGPNRRLSFARKGDTCWNLLDTSCYKDCLFHEGLFYAVTDKGGVITWDLTDNSSPRCEVVISNKEEEDDEDGYQSDLIKEMLCSSKLILAPWGDIILVRREISDFFHDSHFCEEVVQVRVYKIDTKRRKLEEIHDLGDHALFLGGNSGCFSTKNSSNLRSNCVYFFDVMCKDRSKEIGIYDLSKREIEYLSLNFEPVLWIAPN